MFLPISFRPPKGIIFSFSAINTRTPLIHTEYVTNALSLGNRMGPKNGHAKKRRLSPARPRFAGRGSVTSCSFPIYPMMRELPRPLFTQALFNRWEPRPRPVKYDQARRRNPEPARKAAPASRRRILCSIAQTAGFVYIKFSFHGKCTKITLTGTRNMLCY